MKAPKTGWTESQRKVAASLHDAIFDVRVQIEKQGYAGYEAKQLFDSLTRKMRERLERIYEEDLPLAKLVDASDFVVRAEGDAARVGHFRAQAVTSIIENARKQTNKIGLAVAGARGQAKPPTLDLSVSGFAPGSIIVGFVIESANDQVELPVIDAQQQHEVLAVLSEAGRSMDVEDPGGLLADPIVRDVALNAIAQTAPARGSKIDRVQIRVAAAPPIELTQQNRVELQRRLRTPKKRPDNRVRLVGSVREIDLDASRFHVRNIVASALREVRCIVVDDGLQFFNEQLLNKQVEVVGAVDIAPRGHRAVMWVDELRVLNEANGEALDRD